MNLSPLAPLIDIIPAKYRKALYGAITAIAAIVTLLPSVTAVPSWVAAVSGALTILSGLLATANTNTPAAK